MNAIELFQANGKSSGVFACGECRHVHPTQASAEKCCNWRCTKCGEKADQFRTLCDGCRDAVYAEQAVKRLADAELVQDYDGWICCESWCGGNDGYFPSIDEYVDYIFDEGAGDPEDEEANEWPEFVFACNKEVKGIDLDHVIENMCEDGYEDMAENLEGMDELRVAIEKFNEMNRDSLTCWSVNYKKKVAVPQRPIE